MTHDEAVERARAIAAERGWTWREPSKVIVGRTVPLVGRRTLDVWSNASMRGGNVRVVIDAETGEVLESAYLSR